MATVVEIKEELQFNTELTDLLDVMKNIAVFQFRALQRKKERFKRFSQSLKGFFQMIDLSRAPHLFINPKTDISAIVIITSDEGFMGGLNLQVINTAILQQGANEAELLIVGERGTRYLKEMDRQFTAFKGTDDPEGRYRLTLELKDYIIKGIKKGRFGRVFISYPNPISFMVQRVEVIKILPIPAVFEGSQKGEDKESIIIESPLEGIIEYLVEELVLQKLIEVLEDSKLSEFAARAIHLEKGTRELDEKRKYLRFQYFRAYHEIIDKNTRELFSAQIIRRRR